VEDTVLIDIWDILKAYIPKKELSSAAEQIVNYLNEDTTAHALSEMGDNCPAIAQALEELNDAEEFDDEDDW
jgi:uncharacterized protein YqeY